MAVATQEERDAHMGKWSQWMARLAQEGILVGGEPLQSEGKVVEKHGTLVHDGPFAEGKEIVGGYLIVNATDMSVAIESSKACPIFEYDGTIEVREILPFNGES